MKRTTLFLFSISTLLALTFSPVSADPPVGTPPVIDGTIGADWASSGTAYPSGTRLVADPTNDSAWGANNELSNVYVNWDANNLYLAIDYTLDNNGLLVYLDFGTAAGITNFVNASGYTGAWPRNINFPASNGIDAFYGSWNGGAGNFYVANGSTNSTDVTGSCQVATGNQGGFVRHTEIRCPWTVFGFANPVYPGGGVPEINILAAIMGGDNFNGPDVAPNGVSAPGDGTPMNVQANHFAFAGVGPTAVTLSQQQATPTSHTLWVIATAVLLLALATQRRLRRA